MTDPPLIVTAEDIARRLRLPLPLSDEDQATFDGAIQDAQADVVAYLGRELTPQVYTESGLLPYAEGWRLHHDPLLSVQSVTAETYPDDATQPTGRYTVTYLAGIDAADDPELEPIRRFIFTHALYSPDVQQVFRTVAPDRARRAFWVSVEGQQVRYDDVYATSGATPGSGAPGSLPTLKSLDRWRVAGRRVPDHRPTPEGSLAMQPWPYDYPSMNHRSWW
jgi:hypothetical protein